ncbi:pentapeptide repeat-containing protein [Nocardia carnea]|uniref:Pentapeptide repeat-containing protein n=1 Tax=Nocardia carnea TaxID=37328 RepID=A0ABW7TLJ8_9NOCA
MTAFGTLIASFAAVGALYYSNSTLNATNDQLELARRTAQSEQIKSATEQLDSDKESVRLGGIYLIERLAQDSADDRAALRRLLEAFVRTETPHGSCALKVPAPVDIQAALEVITKYTALPDTSNIDLGATCLNDLFLPSPDFSGAILAGSNLSRGGLGGADFSGTALSHTDFTDTVLDSADFRGAILLNANLTGTYLRAADLSGALLYGADLTDAFLGDANLTGVIYDDKTRWPPGFVPPPSSQP